MEELIMEAVICPECEGVSLYWDELKKRWTAPYIDGGNLYWFLSGRYCDCPKELLDKLKQAV